MKKVIIFILLVQFSFQLFATNYCEATKRLENVIELLEKNIIETNFTLTSKQSDSNDVFTTKGTFILKGKKFILKTKELNVYFNGKIEWVYVSEINEVSISEPTDRELSKISPISLLKVYKNISNITDNNKKSTNKVQVIELYPEKNKSDYKSIELKVLKSNNYPIFIQLVDKNGGITQLKLTDFKKKKQFDEKNFNFNSKKYKNIEINDLR